MLHTEFLRNLNCNYERVLLSGNPEEKRYQYCMLSRGGIKGLLPCSLRYINGLAYLYYDITSKQNMSQIYDRRTITRKWLCDYVWSMQKIGEELSRFLLDVRNVLWFPQQIFQDLETNRFFFLYVPYYEGDSGFKKLLEFMIEHIDYEDECLVECVYKMYEEYEQKGQDYLQSQIFQDVKILEEKVLVPEVPETDVTTGKVSLHNELETVEEECLERSSSSDDNIEEPEKKGLAGIFKSKRKRDRELRADYQNAMQLEMAGYAVAEENAYKDEIWGKTLYIEESPVNAEKIYSLYTQEGRFLARLDRESVTIGKKMGEVDVVIEDISVSRMHARIVKEADGIYLEDLNSTNGTYKNGLRMDPYEKRKLEIGDEIRLGKKELIFR